MAASVAKVASDRALSFAAAECIQIHGGIGFTWEYSAHLAYRRGVSNRQLLGSPESHRDALVSLQVNDRGR
jgi:alkylation response protein AidB-like acyl-CoA dehydrogenase